MALLTPYYSDDGKIDAWRLSVEMAKDMSSTKYTQAIQEYCSDKATNENGVWNTKAEDSSNTNGLKEISTCGCYYPDGVYDQIAEDAIEESISIAPGGNAEALASKLRSDSELRDCATPLCSNAIIQWNPTMIGESNPSTYQSAKQCPPFYIGYCDQKVIMDGTGNSWDRSSKANVSQNCGIYFSEDEMKDDIKKKEILSRSKPGDIFQNSDGTPTKTTESLAIGLFSFVAICVFTIIAILITKGKKPGSRP